MGGSEAAGVVLGHEVGVEVGQALRDSVDVGLGRQDGGAQVVRARLLGGPRRNFRVATQGLGSTRLAWWRPLLTVQALSGLHKLCDVGCRCNKQRRFHPAAQPGSLDRRIQEQLDGRHVAPSVASPRQQHPSRARGHSHPAVDQGGS